MKKNKGITLVALVVTVVVLLILAGVSISLVLGNNGIIIKSQNAVNKHANGAAVEDNLLQQQNYMMQEYN